MSKRSQIGKRHLPIGTIVAFDKVVIRKKEYTGSGFHRRKEVILSDKQLSEKKRGVIVGGTYIYEGEVKYFNSEEGGFLVVSKSLFVYLVRTFFRGRHLLVSPYHLLVERVPEYSDYTANYYNEKSIAKARKTQNIPFSPAGHSMNEKQKAELRDIMKDVSRDSKGRWLK